MRKTIEKITNLEAKKFSGTNQSQEELQAALAKHFNKLKLQATRLHDLLGFALAAHIEELKEEDWPDNWIQITSLTMHLATEIITEVWNDSMYQEHIAGYKKLGARQIVSQSETFEEQDEEMEDERSAGSGDPKDTSDSSEHSSHTNESSLSGNPSKTLGTALKQSTDSSADPLLLETVKAIVS